MIAFLEDLALNSWPMIGLAIGGLFVSVCLAVQGKPCFRISRDSWLGLGCYVVSFALGSAYMHADDHSTAVLVWQLSMLALMALYAAVIGLQTENQAEPIPGMYLGLVALYGGFGLWIGGLYPIEEPEHIRRGFELWGFLVIPMLCWVVLLGVNPADLLGKAVWAVVAVAETIPAIEYLDCNVLSPDVFDVADWGITVAKSACVREYGGLYLWAVEIATSAMLFCILALHFCRHKLPDIVKRFTAQ